MDPTVNTTGGQDLSRYDVAYYRRPGLAERWFPQRGMLRPDQLAAVCYTFGVPFWGDEPYTYREPPSWRVMSIGCGAGDLECELERLACEVIGVDPSWGARELYCGKVLQDDIGGIEDCPTVIFCESLEHLPRPVIDRAFARIRRGTRIIITNWPSYHPLEPTPDGWDHITRVDDALFDDLATGCKVIVRRGSHLVLDRII